MAEDRKRNDRGQYESEHTDEEVLSAVRKHEPAGTQEVANELGIARQSADYRLRKLVEKDQVSKKKVGNSLVWTVEV
jgi:predicted ArsR family transcriptional regulator